MVNLVMLRDVIKDSGMTMTGIAWKAGMERATLYNRLSGKGDFKVSEVIGITKALHLSEKQRNAIFFDEQV